MSIIRTPLAVLVAAVTAVVLAAAPAAVANGGDAPVGRDVGPDNGRIGGFGDGQGSEAGGEGGGPGGEGGGPGGDGGGAAGEDSGPGDWSGGAQCSDPDGGPGGEPGDGPAGLRNISVLPGTVARGGQLTITVEGCRTGGDATSRAFATTPLRPFDGSGGTVRGVVTVRQDARPGTYDITVDCAGRTLTHPAAFTVVGGVRAGLGAATATGATKADTVIGTGLLVAGVVGGGIFWARRRAGKRG
ncbi:hypothetical protein [Streptomyces sp. NPDC021356]|uniref:hypothetical protein n=1 Tax=Streptomyces sp. NPDC021356 TaxID=3154900 RepID=UPI0033DEDA35